MIYCILAFLFGGEKTRSTLMITLCAAIVAALCSWLIGHYAYMPRPFVEQVGNTLLDHKDNASFPSNHTLFMSVFATIFLLNKKIKMGVLFLLLSVAMGWSRVYLGVHYPMDIAGAMLLAAVVSTIIWKVSQPLVSKLLRVFYLI